MSDLLVRCFFTLKTLFTTLFLLLAFILLPSQSWAVTGVSGDLIDVFLSDGSMISATPAGRAENQWLITSNGDAIVKRGGRWFYANIEDGQALSTGQPVAVGEDITQPEVTSESLIFSSTHLPAHDLLIGVNDGSSYAPFSFSSDEGNYQQPLLILRVSFSNQDFSYSRSDFNELIFKTGNQDQPSVTDYYLENSYQRFRITPAYESEGVVNDGIIDVRLNSNHPNFGANYGSASRSLVHSALEKANPYIDFQRFDNNRDGVLSANELGIVLMVAGYENAYGGAGAPEPRIWAHKSEFSGLTLDGMGFSFYAMFGEQHQNRLATIGIICHELGHLLFGLPDLYDRQGDSNGVGRWGLMGLGSWNSQGGFSGSSPAHMLAWSKAKAGFLEPNDLAGSADSLDLTSATLTPEAVRVWLDPFRHGEHFLLEYRERTQFDTGLPGEGLLITHVDDWVGVGRYGAQNDVSEHKLVDIEEADGRTDLDEMANRGDRSDVFNHRYGQAYFGEASAPTSLDYRGNSSGVEISNIRISGNAQADITLPYSALGANKGFDDGGVSSPWGNSSGSETKLAILFEMDDQLNWLHGVDVFSHGDGQITINIYADMYQQQLNAPIYSSDSFSVSPGWNRLAFSERFDALGYEQVFVELVARTQNGRPLSIDTAGVVSGHTFVQQSGDYNVAQFDSNVRLLVAPQEAAFSYQVPDKVGIPDNATSSKKSGGAIVSWYIFSLMFLLVHLGRRRCCA